MALGHFGRPKAKRPRKGALAIEFLIGEVVDSPFSQSVRLFGRIYPYHLFLSLRCGNRSNPKFSNHNSYLLSGRGSQISPQGN